MKTLYNLFNKYNLVIFMVALLFSFNLFSNITLETIKFNKERNSIAGSSAIKFSVPNNSKIDSRLIIEEMQKSNVLTIEADDIVFHIPGDIRRGKAIYSKIENFENIPIKSGRFFYIEDYKKGTPYIVIGKNLEQYTQFQDGKKYVQIDNKLLEVIGVMGSDTNSSAFDNTFYINLSGFTLPNENQDYNFDYKVISNDPEDNIKKQIVEICSKYNIDQLQFKSTKEPININDVLDNTFKFLPTIVLVTLFIILNIFNVMKFWIEQNKLRYAINRMVGASKLKLVEMIVKDILSLFVISILLTYIINFPAFYVMKILFPYYGFNNSFMSLTYASIFLILLSICTLVLPVFKIMNKEINSNIRGI